MTGAEGLPPAIPAATVVVIRDAPGGVETLMLRRNSRIAFGGMWAFPGGRVDPADGPLDTPERATTTARYCAVREAAEETELTLRHDELAHFAYWEPPPMLPKRFATWFFLARVEAGLESEVLVDGSEIHEHRWLRAGDVLAMRDAGEVELAPPTWVTLHDLSRFGHSDAAFEWVSSIADPPRYVTHWREVQGGAVAMWHGDAGYETSDPDLPGGRHRLWMFPDGWRLERK